MAASKPKATRPAPAAKIARTLLRPPYRGLVLTAVVLAAAVGGAIYAWQRWGEPATHSLDYIVTPDKISVTKQPAWIHASVKGDVVRTADLTRLDLRDRQLVERVAAAFALHPWVARVERVEKRFPAAIDVRVQYRQPVAVVEIAPRGEAGLLFIDAESVLLPSIDFAPSQARDFLRISGDSETPEGVYGTPWGSERIAGAARIAAAWGERWKALALYRITASQSPSGELLYELRTKAGARIVWGQPPGRESAEEPSADAKIAALAQYVSDKGPLDRDGAPPVVDLRALAQGSANTAGRPKATQR